MKTYRNSFHRGLSIVEVVASTLIVGTMVVASLDTVGAVYRSQGINGSRQLGHGLAHELMSEVMSMPYGDPENGAGAIGTDSAEATFQRPQYDDVDDYHGYSGSPPTHKDGTAITGYDGWQREVTVTWAERLAGDAWSLYDTGIKRVTVTVTSPDGVQTELVALRSRDGVLEQKPAIDTTAIAWIGAELQIGNSPNVAHRATQLTNHSKDSNQ